jgi:hypothetical protein
LARQPHDGDAIATARINACVAAVAPLPWAATWEKKLNSLAAPQCMSLDGYAEKVGVMTCRRRVLRPLYILPIKIHRVSGNAQSHSTGAKAVRNCMAAVCGHWPRKGRGIAASFICPGGMVGCNIDERGARRYSIHEMTTVNHVIQTRGSIVGKIARTGNTFLGDFVVASR